MRRYMPLRLSGFCGFRHIVVTSESPQPNSNIGPDQAPDVSSKLLRERYPDIFRELRSLENPGLGVTHDNLQVESGLHAFWECATCKRTYRKSVIERAFLTKECPMCLADELLKTNLLAVNPVVASEWNPLRNSPALHPRHVLASSKTTMWWLCASCKNEFQGRVDERVAKKKLACPMCDPQRKWAKKAPEIAKEWHPLRNGDYTPNDAPESHPAMSWWLCDSCGHEYEARIHSRVSNGQGCTVCKAASNKDSLKSLASKLPDKLSVPISNHPRNNKD